MATSKVKIVIAGPSGSGKTVIANLLSDQSDSPTSTTPTVGVRILEIERDPPKTGRRGESKIQVELWDSSGDHRYEKCWPAIKKDAQGVILVFSPDDPPTAMENWAANFPVRMGISQSQCLVLVHYKTGKPGTMPQMPRQLERVSSFQTSLEDASSVKVPFEKLFGSVYTALMASQDMMENEIMSTR